MFHRGHWKQLDDTAGGARVKGADEKSFTTGFLADKAVEFIRAHEDEPFCYVLGIPDSHLRSIDARHCTSGRGALRRITANRTVRGYGV